MSGVPASMVAALLAVLNRELAPRVGFDFGDAIARLDRGDAEGGMAEAFTVAAGIDIGRVIDAATHDAAAEVASTVAASLIATGHRHAVLAAIWQAESSNAPEGGGT